jgi:hypothetical protein
MKFLKARFYRNGSFQGRLVAEWEKAAAAYREHLASIMPALPESARDLVQHEKRHPFHDANVERVCATGSHEITVDLSDRRLEFLGAASWTYPEELEAGTIWLHTEIDAALNGAFELRALLDSGELRIVAREVRVFDKVSRRYLIPSEPPAKPSELFLDRKGKRRNRR